MDEIGIGVVGAMIGFEKSGVEKLAIEREIFNSVPDFNRLTYQRPEITDADLLKDHDNAAKLGCERYLIKQEQRYVGVLEFLPNNPSDQMPWLGLLVIHGDCQRNGLATAVYQLFEEQLGRRGFGSVRLGVIKGNRPGTEFWRKMGFVQYAELPVEEPLYDCYEKEVASK